MELDMTSSDQDYGVPGGVNPDTSEQILLVFPNQGEEGKSRDSPTEMSKVVHQQLQQMADNGEGRIVEDNDDAITYIQIECGQAEESFTNIRPQLQSSQASTSVTTCAATSGTGLSSAMLPQGTNDSAGRIPPWAYSTPKYQTQMTQMVQPPSQQLGTNPMMAGTDQMPSVPRFRTALFKPRKLIPFPGTNGYPKYDDSKTPPNNLSGPTSLINNNIVNNKRSYPPSTPGASHYQAPSNGTSLYQTTYPNWSGSVSGRFYNDNNYNQVNNSFSPNLNTLQNSASSYPSKGSTVDLSLNAQKTTVDLVAGMMNKSRKRSASEESVSSWDTSSRCFTPSLPNGMVGIYVSGKKQRIIFSDSQCARMREAFEANPYITKAERAKLAESLDISEDNVAVWFKNHRSKMKRRFQNGLFVKREEGDYEESNPGTGNTSTQIIEML